MSQSPLILSFIYKRRNSSSVTDKRLSKPQGSNRVPHPQRGSRFHCRFAQQLEPTADAGLLIGAEMYGRTPNTPDEELDEISAALFNRFMQQRPFPFGILLL